MEKIMKIKQLLYKKINLKIEIKIDPKHNLTIKEFTDQQVIIIIVVIIQIF